MYKGSKGNFFKEAKKEFSEFFSINVNSALFGGHSKWQQNKQRAKKLKRGQSLNFK